MTALYGLAMGLLALAPLLAILPGVGARGRLAAGCAAVGCVLLVGAGLYAAIAGARLVLDLGSWLGFGASALVADPLAGIFLALAGVVGAAVALASAGAPEGRRGTTLGTALLLFVAVAIGADNGFLFLLAWEATTVCVYLIASGGSSREDLVAGYLTGGLAKLGGAALLAAFGLMYAATHSFALATWSHAAIGSGTRGVVFALLLAGFATKVGAVPLQGGLPAGYGAAPRLGAAWLSVALCAGFYGLWRFAFMVLGPLPAWCGDALLVIGAITALVGITYALAQDDLRRFLGYSTVEHTGIALTGFAVALLGHAAGKPVLAAAGLLAATLQVVAHGLAKTLALIVVDRVELATGERTLDPLGGMLRVRALSGFALGAAALSLAAIPPLGGFVSEWFTFQALLQGFRMPTLLSQLLCALAAAALALTAGLGLLGFARLYGFAFLGPPRAPLRRLGAGRWVWIGLLGLGAIVLALGALAPWEIRAIGSALRPALGFDLAATAVTHPLVLGPVFPGFAVLAPTWLSIVLPTYAALALLVVLAAGGRGRVRRAPVWVTGSGAELAAVQYRPSAYSNPMRVILRGPLGYRSRLVRTGDTGAEPRFRLETSVVFAIDRFVYAPLARGALRISAWIRATQSGRLSWYLLYMLVSLLAALALVPILR